MIAETLLLEETRFSKTLERGLGLLAGETEQLGRGDILSGEVAFKLYDTYGFPLDLTQDALKARQIGVDTQGFEASMTRQRQEARKAWAGSGDAATEQIWFGLGEKLAATEFLGYEMEKAEGELLAIVKQGKSIESLSVGNKREKNKAKKGGGKNTAEEIALIFNQTPFYGESGGQIGDRGIILFAGGGVFEVEDCHKQVGGLFVHYGHLQQGRITTGESASLEVDVTRRMQIRCNHSATHLIHEALREILGCHVAQKGSLVAKDRLRFDFSHPKPMTADELAKVEVMTNEIVLQNGPVKTRLMGVDEAVAAGAMALFGEKYGDEVRVVTMGTALHGGKQGKVYSMELCGGTHVNNTGEIGLVHLVNDSAVASGVRRIEALTGNVARCYLSSQDQKIKQLAAILKAPPAQLLERAEALIKERKSLERQLGDAMKKLAMGGGGGAGEVEDLDGTAFLGRVVDDLPAKELRGLVDDGKQMIKTGIVVIIGRSGGKAGIAVGVTDDLTGIMNAVDLVKIGSQALGGKGGGGRADMAQAGGPDSGKAAAALAAIRQAIVTA